jgi:hypothetical protein
MSLMWAIVLTLIGLIDWGMFGAIRRSSPMAFDVLAAIDAAVTVAVLAWFAVRTAQRWNVAKLPGRPSAPVFRFGKGWTGNLLSSLAQMGFTVLLLVAAVALLIVPGLFIFMFLTSLMPEPPAERSARLWMAGQRCG